MSDQGSSKAMWMPLMIGFVFAGLAFWLSSGSEVEPSTGRVEVEESARGEESVPAEIRDVVVPTLRIAAGKRLTIAERDLPSQGALSLALDIPDLARGVGRRKARIVSETAGRLETEAIPLAGTDSGLRLEISQDYLARGIYMIEVETADVHPLRFRRYVLEIE